MRDNIDQGNINIGARHQNMMFALVQEFKPERLHNTNRRSIGCPIVT